MVKKLFKTLSFAVVLTILSSNIAFAETIDKSERSVEVQKLEVQKQEAVKKLSNVMDSNEFKEKAKKIKFTQDNHENQSFEVGDYKFTYSETTSIKKPILGFLSNGKTVKAASEGTFMEKNYILSVYQAALRFEIGTIKSTFDWEYTDSTVAVNTPPSVDTSTGTITGVAAYWKDAVCTPSNPTTSTVALKMEATSWLTIKIFVSGLGDIKSTKYGFTCTAKPGGSYTASQVN